MSARTWLGRLLAVTRWTCGCPLLTQPPPTRSPGSAPARRSVRIGAAGCQSLHSGEGAPPGCGPSAEGCSPRVRQWFPGYLGAQPHQRPPSLLGSKDPGQGPQHPRLIFK